MKPLFLILMALVLVGGGCTLEPSTRYINLQKSLQACIFDKGGIPILSYNGERLKDCKTIPELYAY